MKASDGVWRRPAGRRSVLLSLVLAALGVASAVAQVPGQRRGGGDRGGFATESNVPYDGRFTFVRLRFATAMDGIAGYGREPWWAHDYPRAERNLMNILEAVTELRPTMDGSNILALDDPDLFRYPFAYICEVGYWDPTEAEVESLRAYLGKGGFIMVDDFRGFHLDNFVHQMKRVLPGMRLVELDETHRIFRSFFDIEDLDLRDMNYRGMDPVWYGIFEDNDPDGRMLMIVNYNNDIGEYWEYSDTGFLPVDVSNQAYKFGINYIVYAMTH